MPARAVEAAPHAPTFPFPTSRALLDHVDSMPEAVSGVLAFDAASGPPGHVFVESRRVCWAATPGLGRRLVERLGQVEGSAPAGALEEAFHRARREGRPFGEFLVSGGLIAPDALRGALRAHTALALSTLVRPGARAAWLPRPGGYQPRFAFRPLELAAALSALENPERAQRADAILRGVLHPGDLGLVLDPEKNAMHPEVVATAGDVSLTIDEADEAAQWAADTLGVASTFAGEGTPAVLGRRDSMNVAAWAESGLLAVAFVDNEGLGRMVRRRGAR